MMFILGMLFGTGLILAAIELEFQLTRWQGRRLNNAQDQAINLTDPRDWGDSW